MEAGHRRRAGGKPIRCEKATVLAVPNPVDPEVARRKQEERNKHKRQFQLVLGLAAVIILAVVVALVVGTMKEVSPPEPTAFGNPYVRSLHAPLGNPGCVVVGITKSNRRQSEQQQHSSIQGVGVALQPSPGSPSGRRSSSFALATFFVLLWRSRLVQIRERKMDGRCQGRVSMVFQWFWMLRLQHLGVRCLGRRSGVIPPSLSCNHLGEFHVPVPPEPPDPRPSSSIGPARDPAPHVLGDRGTEFTTTSTTKSGWRRRIPRAFSP